VRYGAAEAGVASVWVVGVSVVAVPAGVAVGVVADAEPAGVALGRAGAVWAEGVVGVVAEAEPAVVALAGVGGAAGVVTGAAVAVRAGLLVTGVELVPGVSELVGVGAEDAEADRVVVVGADAGVVAGDAVDVDAVGELARGLELLLLGCELAPVWSGSELPPLGAGEAPLASPTPALLLPGAGVCGAVAGCGWAGCGWAGCGWAGCGWAGCGCAGCDCAGALLVELIGAPPVDVFAAPLVQPPVCLAV
jgi:hypothetical protein